MTAATTHLGHEVQHPTARATGRKTMGRRNPRKLARKTIFGAKHH